MRSSLLAELPDSESLIEAIHRLSGRHLSLEAFTPFPDEEVEEALGRRRSRAGFLMFVCGVLGAGGAYFLMWLINVVWYPANVGDRPNHYPLIFTPITFEMGVLLASFGGFFGLLALARLLRPWYPQAEVPEFVSATRDRFWLQASGELDDESAGQLAEVLREIGASEVVLIDGGRR